MLGEGVGAGEGDEDSDEEEDEFGDQAHELVNTDGALPGLPPLNNQRSDATRNLKGYHTMSSTLTPMFEKQRKAFSSWQQPSWMGARRGVNFCSMTMNDYAKPQCVTRLFQSPSPQPQPTLAVCVWLLRCKLRVSVSAQCPNLLPLLAVVDAVQAACLRVCVSACLRVCALCCLAFWGR